MCGQRTNRSLYIFLVQFLLGKRFHWHHSGYCWNSPNLNSISELLLLGTSSTSPTLPLLPGVPPSSPPPTSPNIFPHPTPPLASPPLSPPPHPLNPFLIPPLAPLPVLLALFFSPMLASLEGEAPSLPPSSRLFLVAAFPISTTPTAILFIGSLNRT